MRRVKALGIGIVLILLICLGYLAWFFVDRFWALKRAPQGWRQIQPGMKTDEVVALLGYAPSRSRATFGPNALGQFRTNESWNYAFGQTGQAVYSGRYVVTFTNGTVDRVEIR